MIKIQNYLFGFNLFSVLSIVLLFIINILGVFLYKELANKRGILANPSSRGLHEKAIPRGGGIVFASFFSIVVFLLWSINFFPEKVLILFGIGGLLASLFGLIDDVKDIKAFKKLILQFSISIFVFFYLNEEISHWSHSVPIWLIFPPVILYLVWMINAYNFMDGVDGMAASGAIFASVVIALTIFLTTGSFYFVVLLLLLAICVSGFLIFNWPPASIFMGDSGSVFLGYFFGVIILYTTITNEVSIYTWLIAFGYFISDTTLTLFSRLLLVKKWYSAHRSHAYQNLARITESHFKVTSVVVIYKLFWLFPLAILSIKLPDLRVMLMFFAIIPSAMVSYKYGPFFSHS